MTIGKGYQNIAIVMDLLRTEYGRRPTQIEWKSVGATEQRAVIGTAVVRVDVNPTSGNVVGEIIGLVGEGTSQRVYVANPDLSLNPKAFEETKRAIVVYLGKLALDIVNIVLAENADIDLTSQ